MSFDKRTIIKELLEGLAEEIEVIKKSALAAHEAATHEESRAEDSHDTRSIEASYLAGAQTARVAELQRLMQVLRFFPVLEYKTGDLIGPGALVELSCRGTRSFAFIVPQGGGLVARIEDCPVQVVTPQSPIGEALLGRKLGDLVEVETRTGSREYSVLSIS
jgi:transcription elongation GreA/GreB family factor